jgi:hypothetical protein
VFVLAYSRTPGQSKIPDFPHNLNESNRMHCYVCRRAMRRTEASRILLRCHFNPLSRVTIVAVKRQLWAYLLLSSRLVWLQYTVWRVNLYYLYSYKYKKHIEKDGRKRSRTATTLQLKTLLLDPTTTQDILCYNCSCIMYASAEEEGQGLSYQGRKNNERDIATVRVSWLSSGTRRSVSCFLIWHAPSKIDDTF